jgi:hypothetical protein
MGKGSSSPPPAPNQQATIAQQTAANEAAITRSAAVNAVDVYGPSGSTTYQRNADGTPASQHTTLSASGQHIYDQQQSVGGKLWDAADSRANGLIQTPYSMSGTPYDPRGYDTSTMPNWSAHSTGRGDAGGVGGYRGAFGAGISANDGPSVQQPRAGEKTDNSVANTGPISANDGPRSEPAQMPGQATPKFHGAFGTGGQPPMDDANTRAHAGDNVGDRTDMPFDPRSYGNMNYFSNQVGDSIYDQGMSRMDPQFKAQDREFEQTMADRGIPMTGEAYKIAAAEKGRNQNDMRASLNNQATAGALQATQGIVGLEQGLRGTAWNENLQGHQQEQKDWLQRLQTEQNLRGSINNETLTERNQGINEIAAIGQGSPALAMPNAPNIPTYQMQAPDVGGIVNSSYQMASNNYNAQQNRNDSMWRGAFGAGATAIPYMLSSPTLKIVHGDA